MKQRLLYYLLLLTLLVTGSSNYAWGAPTTVYERTLAQWVSTDVNNGTGTWIANAASADTEKGLYVTGNGGRAATLTFSHTDMSLQTIDIVFNNAGNTGDGGNFSYIDIGNALRIRSNQQNQNGHVIINGTENAISHCNVKNINRGGDLWTIHIEINTATNTVTALTLTGDVGGTNAASFTLSEAASLGSNATYNTITLGTNRVKGTPSAGIQSIKIVEEEQDLTSAPYTINYQLNGQTVKTESSTAAIETTVNATSPFTVGDQKYYITDGATTAFTIASSGNTFNVPVRLAGNYSYTVKAVAGNNVLKSLASGSNLEGESISYYWPAVLNVEGTLYTAPAVNSGYKGTFSLDQDNKEITVAYAASSDITSLVYLAEGEDIFTRGTGSNADTRCSMGAGGFQTESIDFTSLNAGKYILVVSNRCSGTRENIHVFTAGTGDNASTILSAGGFGYNSLWTSEEFTINKNTTLYFQGGSENQYVDYLYIYRTGDAPLDKGTWAVDTVTAETGWCIGDSITITMDGGELVDNGGAQYLKYADGGTLTLTSAKEGYGFEKIKINASKLNASASTGTLNNGVWTGSANEVTFTFTGENAINSIIIGSDKMPELETVSIAEFKAAQGEKKLNLSNAEILYIENGNVMAQDDEAGILIWGVDVKGAQPGKKLSGSLAGIYNSEENAIVNGTQTNFTTVSSANGETTSHLLNVEEAIDVENVFRLAILKGVSISEEEGTFYASDKTGKKIQISNQMIDDLTEVLADGDVLASLTGITIFGSGEDNIIMPRSADDIVSGLIWQANDLTLGDDILSLNLTSGKSLKKLGELEAGDEVHIELAELSIPEVLTPMFINTASGKNIYTIYLNQDNMDEGTVSFPITKDMVKDINKHGLTIGADAKATIIYVEPGKYEAGDDDIWLSSEEALINGLAIGEAHFADVREGDVLTMESTAAGAAMTAGESEITSGEALTSAQAEALQGGALNMSIPTTGLSKVSFEKIAVRDDIFAVEENEDGTYDSFAQGEKVTVNGMIMTFGGDDPEGKEYVFAEVYPDVNNFGSATEGNSFIFEPTKDGQLEVTLELENNKLFVTEEGETLKDFNGITTVSNNKISFPVEATKTYKVFANEGNIKFFGFKFTPADENATNVAKDIATFKLMAASAQNGDTLLLKDAMVKYIDGDDVFVEDASGSIDFYRTQIQYYVGQVLNGYIVGKSGIVSEKNPVPALLRTDGTKYGQFKVTDKVTPEPTVISMEDVDDYMNVARFVKLEELKVKRNDQGFKILTDGENSILIEDHFGVFYELDDNLLSIEGIIGLNSEYEPIFWPTSKEGVVAGKSDTHKTIKTLDFTTATYAENPTIVLSEEQAGTAYETGNAMQQKIYVATAPAEIAGGIAFQAVSNGSGKGWWIRPDKGGLWTYNAQRSAAVLNMKAGYRVTFNTTQQADAVMTLTDATGAPDGPFVFQLSEDGTAYICYMLEDGNVGFCGNKSVGYISSIEIAEPKKAMEVAEYIVNFVDEDGAALKDAEIRRTLAGLTATLTAKDKEAITIDGVTYLYDSDNSANTEIQADGETVITVKYAKASSDLSYNVQENVNGKVVRETKGNDIQGAKIKVPYRRYNLDNGTLYQKGATSKEYNYSFTLNANNQVETLEYAATDKTNVVFLTEGEDIDGATVSAHANVLVRASNSASGFAGKDLEVVKLSAGTYKMTIGCFDTSKDGNTAVFNFAANGSDLFTITSAGNNLSEVSSEEFTLTEEATIVLKAGGSESKSIDYLFITSDNGSVVKGLSVELAHTASSWCDANKDTYFSDVDAEKEIVNNEAFNAAWQGAAYMQFDYYIPEGQTITSAILKFTVIGESRGDRSGSVYCVNASESLDYTAMAAGNQKVNLAGTKVADITFPKSASALIEQDVTETLKTMVAAGQSYIIFKVTGNPGRGEINGKGSEFAPTLTIATDGDATGINELKAARQFEDGAIYNLRGQKVSGTLKPGLYIKNGKKIVVE